MYGGIQKNHLYVVFINAFFKKYFQDVSFLLLQKLEEYLSIMPPNLTKFMNSVIMFGYYLFFVFFILFMFFFFKKAFFDIYIHCVTFEPGRPYVTIRFGYITKDDFM